MLGEDCPPANGCALYGLCGDGEVCRDDPQAANGFRCECVCAHQYLVSSTGGVADSHKWLHGVYKKTTRTWSGRPVWRHTGRDDRFLFYNGDWERWVISKAVSNDRAS